MIDQLLGFWCRTFKELSFHFANPRLAEEQLAIFDELPLEKRAKQLVWIMAQRLGIRLPVDLNAVRDWLYR